jgi:hypothetical protein
MAKQTHHGFSFSQSLMLGFFCYNVHSLFPSHPDAPRVIVTNGMMVPSFSDKDHYEKLNAMGNTMYGQMTAGSFCCS